MKKLSELWLDFKVWIDMKRPRRIFNRKVWTELYALRHKIESLRWELDGLKASRGMVPEMYDLLSGELDVNPELWSKRIYKGTDCGAWLEYGDDYIRVGSIVEGVDDGTQVHELKWPFTKDEFWNAVDNVEKEARDIWNSTHGCESCAKLWHEEDIYINEWEQEFEGCDGMTPVHPQCKDCGGGGAVI